jgi:hypothetical protein
MPASLNSSDRRTSADRRTGRDDGLIDRLLMLRSVVPALASELAAARREGAQLRRENAVLQSHVALAEGRAVPRFVEMPLTPASLPLVRAGEAQS